MKKTILNLLLLTALTFGITCCKKETFEPKPEPAPVECINERHYMIYDHNMHFSNSGKEPYYIEYKLNRIFSYDFDSDIPNSGTFTSWSTTYKFTALKCDEYFNIKVSKNLNLDTIEYHSFRIYHLPKNHELIENPYLLYKDTLIHKDSVKNNIVLSLKDFNF